MHSETVAPPLVLSHRPALGGDLIAAIVCTGMGVALTAFASRDIEPLAFVWPALIVAALLPLAFLGMRAARTSMVVFGACVLAAGLCQLYTWTVFSVPQTTSDAELFYDLSRRGLLVETPAEIRLVLDATFSVMVWRTFYEIAKISGLHDGLWIGLTINALLVALSAAITVRIVEILFPGDMTRARRIGRLLAWCGMFWLFGATFVRDAFALFLQMIILAAFVWFLQRPSVRRFLAAGAIAGLATWLMRGVRLESLPAIALLPAIAVAAWMLQGRGVKRMGRLIVGVGLGVVIMAFVLDQVVSVGRNSAERYLALVEEVGAGGLGYRLVISQPLPIRLITGALFIHVFPIPFWVGFTFNASEYHWLKSFHAIFMIAITPLAVLGIGRILQRVKEGAPGTVTLTFLAFYWIAMLEGVVATSVENRHLGQFLPAMLILAVVPDLDDPVDRRALRRLMTLWYGGVFAIHMLWIML